MNHLKIANNMIAGFYERGKDSTPTDVGQAAASVIAAHALIAIAEQLEKNYDYETMDYREFTIKWIPEEDK